MTRNKENVFRIEFRLLLSRTLLLLLLLDRSVCKAISRDYKETKYTGNKLILILMDGFRWDYLNRGGLEGFQRIRREGVHAKYMEPAFPSLSFPNYYTIATGRFVESHGVTLNSMWDPVSDQMWEPNSNNTSHSHWWEDAEPLWTTATKAGLRTDMYLWPGCPATIFGTKPTSCVPYRLRIWLNDFERELNEITVKMEEDSSDVGLVYCEQPDLSAHVFGPNSFIVNVIIRKLDHIFLAYLEMLDKKGLRDKINIIITSDHGTTPVGSKKSHKIPLTDYLDPNDVDKTMSHGAVVGIFPKEGKTDMVLLQLKRIKGAQVWRREDLPKRFHYQSKNTPPIVILADPHHRITALPSIEKTDHSYEFVPPTLADSILKGEHGYDPKVCKDMMGVFLAIGPDFKIGYEAPPIKNVDVYNLAMSLIDLEPKANNGTWNSVKDFLRCSNTTCDTAAGTKTNNYKRKPF